MTSSASAIQLVRLRKTFGEVVAVDDVDLEIAAGEFFSLLGPSGSGKTTVLRMIAGFELPSAGAVLLHGVDVTHLAPYDRDVNTVFQDYALFPHMTVQQNVEYGLKVKGVGKERGVVAPARCSTPCGLAPMASAAPASSAGGNVNTLRWPRAGQSAESPAARRAPRCLGPQAA